MSEDKPEPPKRELPKRELPPWPPAAGQAGDPPANVTALADVRAAQARKSDHPAGEPAPDSRLDAENDVEEGDNPLALVLGALVILALVVGAWFLIDSMKCNPLFSDAGLYRSQACR